MRFQPTLRTVDKITLELHMGDVISILGHCDPAMLKKMGYFSYSFAHKLHERVVLCERDFVKTLYFRKQVYLNERRVDENCKLEDFTNNYDKYNKIINLLFNREIVASLSLNFPSDSDFIECLEGNYSDQSFKYIWNKKKTMEVSRLYVDRRFQDTDIYQKIGEIIHRELVLSDRESVIAFCSQDMEKVYRKFGFKQTSMTFSHQGNRFDKLTIMVSKQKLLGIYGLHVGPWKWALYCGGVYDDYSFRLRSKSLFKFVIAGYRVLRPFILNINKMIKASKWALNQFSIKRPLSLRYKNY